MKAAPAQDPAHAAEAQDHHPPGRRLGDRRGQGVEGDVVDDLDEPHAGPAAAGERIPGRVGVGEGEAVERPGGEGDSLIHHVVPIENHERLPHQRPAQEDGQHRPVARVGEDGIVVAERHRQERVDPVGELAADEVAVGVGLGEQRLAVRLDVVVADLEAGAEVRVEDQLREAGGGKAFSHRPDHIALEIDDGEGVGGSGRRQRRGGREGCEKSRLHGGQAPRGLEVG